MFGVFVINFSRHHSLTFDFPLVVFLLSLLSLNDSLDHLILVSVCLFIDIVPVVSSVAFIGLDPFKFAHLFQFGTKNLRHQGTKNSRLNAEKVSDKEEF